MTSAFHKEIKVIQLRTAQLSNTKSSNLPNDDGGGILTQDYLGAWGARLRRSVSVLSRRQIVKVGNDRDARCAEPQSGLSSKGERWGWGGASALEESKPRRASLAPAGGPALGSTGAPRRGEAPPSQAPGTNGFGPRRGGGTSAKARAPRRAWRLRGASRPPQALGSGESLPVLPAVATLALAHAGLLTLASGPTRDRSFKTTTVLGPGNTPRTGVDAAPLSWTSKPSSQKTSERTH
ncbi:uncharacterized protein LOC133091753 [Eubalaena glacialis]|uniref:uncharacterized protein LOC133091753 n=1 Tax=Eubalaena glacialis TaxID=27606 RepID=UPI002A59ED5B|nr:uncharacterized protein LOC133091753 [Eubalaena glacialis]